MAMLRCEAAAAAPPLALAPCLAHRACTASASLARVSAVLPRRVRACAPPQPQRDGPHLAHHPRRRHRRPGRGHQRERRCGLLRPVRRGPPPHLAPAGRPPASRAERFAVAPPRGAGEVTGVRISGRFCWVEFADVRAAHSALACAPRRLRAAPPARPRRPPSGRAAVRALTRPRAHKQGLAFPRPRRRLDGETTGGHHLRVSQSKSAIHSNGLRRPGQARTRAQRPPRSRTAPGPCRASAPRAPASPRHALTAVSGGRRGRRCRAPRLLRRRWRRPCTARPTCSSSRPTA